MQLMHCLKSILGVGGISHNLNTEFEIIELLHTSNTINEKRRSFFFHSCDFIKKEIVRAPIIKVKGINRYGMVLERIKNISGSIFKLYAIQCSLRKNNSTGNVSCRYR